MILLTCALFANLGGCGGQTSRTPVAPGTPTSTAADRIESRLGPSEIPKTPEAFKDEFVRRFNEDNNGAFRDLCYWEGVSEEMRRKNIKVFMMGMRRSRVTTARIERCSADEFARHFDQPNSRQAPNLPPTHKLCCETASSDGSMKTAGEYPVGTKNGGYYLCVGIPAE